jgi:hypothetical protein
MSTGRNGAKDVYPLIHAITNPGVQRLARAIAGQDCEPGETPIEAIERRSVEAAGGRSRERSEPSRHIANEIAPERLSMRTANCEGKSSFLKKRTKKLLHIGTRRLQRRGLILGLAFL